MNIAKIQRISRLDRDAYDRIVPVAPARLPDEGELFSLVERLSRPIGDFNVIVKSPARRYESADAYFLAQVTLR